MALCSLRSQSWPRTPDCPASTCWVLTWHVPCTMPAIKSNFNSGIVSFKQLALLKILMNYFKFSIPSPWNPAYILYPQYSSEDLHSKFSHPPSIFPSLPFTQFLWEWASGNFPDGFIYQSSSSFLNSAQAMLYLSTSSITYGKISQVKLGL